MGILKKIAAESMEGIIPVPGYDGFEIKLVFCGNNKLESILKSCNRKVYNHKTRETVEEIDNDKLTRKIATNILVGWTGLTMGMVKELMPTKEEELKELNMQDTDIIEYDVENAESLLRTSNEFLKLRRNTII